MRLLSLNSRARAREDDNRPAMPNSKSLSSNIVGAFLMLLIALAAIIVLLWGPMSAQIERAQAESGILEWGTALGYGLLIVFLAAVPAAFLVRALSDYRSARSLDRIGIMTKGRVVEKWIENSGGKPDFCVRYSYPASLSAVQRVDQQTYEQLQREDRVFVLVLKDQPEVSRLDLD
jgi:hypothetical protein